MTKETFERLLSTVFVRTVTGGRHHGPGLHIEGITQEELSEIVTLAGEKLGAIPEGAKVNPEYLATERDWHIITP